MPALSSDIDSAKLHAGTVYALETLYFAYLRTQGANPSEHAVMGEIARVRKSIDGVNAAAKTVDERAEAAERARVNAERKKKGLPPLEVSEPLPTATAAAGATKGSKSAKGGAVKMTDDDIAEAEADAVADDYDDDDDGETEAKSSSGKKTKGNTKGSKKEKGQPIVDKGAASRMIKSGLAGNGAKKSSTKSK